MSFGLGEFHQQSSFIIRLLNLLLVGYS